MVGEDLHRGRSGNDNRAMSGTTVWCWLHVPMHVSNWSWLARVACRAVSDGLNQNLASPSAAVAVDSKSAFRLRFSFAIPQREINKLEAVLEPNGHGPDAFSENADVDADADADSDADADADADSGGDGEADADSDADADDDGAGGVGADDDADD